MVSPINVAEEFRNVRGKFCFYLDLQDRGLASSLSNRIEDLGLRQQWSLGPCVTHVVRSAAEAEACARPPTWAARSVARRTRADAMLERVRAATPPDPTPHLAHNYKTLTIREAIILLDRIYERYYKVSDRICERSAKTYIKYFKKHFIKVEILDRLCRPLYKEFDEWPEISLEPTIPNISNNQDCNLTGSKKKMTRKSRPRIKEREQKEPKGGHCEICNTDYADTAEHQKSLHHLAFVRDDNNFLSLDTLIGAGGDIASFLDKALPVNGERRSLRKMCNGDLDGSHTRSKRSNKSQSPDSTLNGGSPRRPNGSIEDERRHNTRCSKRSSDRRTSEERQYYKVVGVSTKLRSSGGFASKTKDSAAPSCNGGSKPLVVKFRKIRQSELSVLSDEAEQFMFPKRASSTSSTSSDDGREEVLRKSPPRLPISLERRRLARPVALKEESSEEDSWPENKRKRRKRTKATVRKIRPTRSVPVTQTAEEVTPTEVEPVVDPEPCVEQPQVQDQVSPLREEPVETCLKWEDGKLKYTPAVEQLEFAFESVPQSEPWFETFKRQDQDKLVTRNISSYFALYTKSPKLPYEMAQLPPLKPNCCSLNDSAKREEKPGPSRSYGTRGNKMQKIRKRTAVALLAMEAHPRKSPREHASTLAMLGSAGISQRMRNAEDTKSTASEDTVSETLSNNKVEVAASEKEQESERVHKFFSEVFEDIGEYDIPDGEGAALVASGAAPDLLELVSECEGCEMIRDEIASSRTVRRGHRVKKKNKTGWPNKKKAVRKADAVDESTADETASETDEPPTVVDRLAVEDGDSSKSEDREERKDDTSVSSDDKPLRLDVKLLLRAEEKKSEKRKWESCEKEPAPPPPGSESRKRRGGGTPVRQGLPAVGAWLQPIVRVARVDPHAARRLRSAARARPRPRPTRLR